MSRAAETTPARFLGIAEGTGFLGRMIIGNERIGFLVAFTGRAPAYIADEAEYERGAVLAAQVCFAQGALAELMSDDDEGERICPYTAGTPAWEAWVDGFNAAANAALDIED